MSKNFKPAVWSQYIENELKKDLVFGNFCDYRYEGEIKKGGKVKIVGTGKVNVRKREAGKPITVDTMNDNAQFMEITEEDYFAFGVDDVDKAQAIPNFINDEMKEAEESLADSADRYLASVAAKGALASMKSESTELAKVEYPLSLLDRALVGLYKNNVSTKTKLEAALNPSHAVACKNKLGALFTNNVEYLKQGAVGQYGNILIKMSNNLYNDGTDDYEIVRTSRALAFANQINKVETLRDQGDFRDIVRGLHTYGGKLVRPKELYAILVH